MKKKKQVIEKEIVYKDIADKTVYHYIDTINNVDVKSKEVFKQQDRFILYPFYLDRKTNKVVSKYRKIKTLTFEGLKQHLPSGFIKLATRGYGFTRPLKPFIRFVEKNLNVSDITISGDKKTRIKGNTLILNVKDLDNIRKQVTPVIRELGEKTRTLVNNYFSELFPSKFQNRREKYQRGTINRIVAEYDAVEKNLSSDDKQVILNLFQKLSSAKRGTFERQELVLTREKIDRKFIEDVLKKFKKLLSFKKIKEERWHEFFKENGFIFSQLFAYPTVLFKDKAYVGGKTIQDDSGKIVDFLYANQLTRNSVLIEIKKHTTKLLSNKPYRGSDVFHMDKELSGAINQALDQKETYCKKFETIRRPEDDITSFNPRCVIIIGKIDMLSKKQLKAFELLRSSFKDIEIIAFDELYIRINSILSIFKKDDNKS